MRPVRVRVGVQPEKTHAKEISFIYRYFFTFALPLSLLGFFFFSEFPQSGIHGLAQAQTNYIPGSICGVLSFLIWPTELEEMILIESLSHKVAVFHPFQLFKSFQ